MHAPSLSHLPHVSSWLPSLLYIFFSLMLWNLINKFFLLTSTFFYIYKLKFLPYEILLNISQHYLQSGLRVRTYVDVELSKTCPFNFATMHIIKLKHRPIQYLLFWLFFLKKIHCTVLFSTFWAASVLSQIQEDEKFFPNILLIWRKY